MPHESWQNVTFFFNYREAGADRAIINPNQFSRRESPCMRFALYQPDIPQNTGALLRLAACLGVAVDIIEPCGFALSEKSLRRTGMDYVDLVDLTLHPGWSAFCEAVTEQRGRLVLLTTKAAHTHIQTYFRSDDVLLLGRESAGVPEAVRQRAALSVRVPLVPPARSLNVVLAAGIVLGEALRQTGGFSGIAPRN